MVPEPQGTSDEELARQTQGGSMEAFEQLVYRYEGRLYRFAVGFCRNSSDAREVAQDTFVRAYQAIAHYDASQAFAPWLFTIARRKCIDRYRAARPLTDAPLPEEADAQDPAELLASWEERQNLWDLARRVLSDTQFHALWLRYAEEMDVPQIARVLAKTRTHVKVLLFRARLTLGRHLEACAPPGRSQSACAANAKRKAATVTAAAAAQIGRPGLPST